MGNKNSKDNSNDIMYKLKFILVIKILILI